MKNLLSCLFVIFFVLSCEKHEKLTAYVKPLKEVHLKLTHFINEISFLFLIDASGSMDKFNKTLAENIDKFLQPVLLNYPYYNYNFAITSLSPLRYFKKRQNIFFFVDYDKNTKCGLNPSAFSRNSNLGPYLHYSFKDMGVDNIGDLVCVLSHNITTIKGDRGDEPHFDSLSYIVNNADSHFKQGFFGKNKMLVLFFISDSVGEDDTNYVLSAGRTNHSEASEAFSEDQLKSLQSVTGHSGTKNIRSYAVVLDESQGDRCGEGEDSLFPYPYHLYAFIRKTGGLKISICDNTWGRKLSNVFDDLKKILHSRVLLYLNEVPRLDTIQVIINNKEVPHDNQKGWYFNPHTLSIDTGLNFNFLSYADEEKAHLNYDIIVKYHPLNIELLR